MRIILTTLFLVVSFVFQAQVNRLDSLNRKQGPWVRYWKGSAQPQFEGSFYDGMPVGQFRYYYPTGEVSGVVEHIKAKYAYVTFYHRNLEVMSEGFYKNKLRDSLWLNYNREGLTISAERFEKGKLDGKRVVFYLKDQLEWGRLYKKSETTYADSLKEGPYTSYFSSGKIMEKGFYKNDKKYGEWKIFSSKGYLDHITRFKAGKTHGWIEFFDTSGALTERVLYQDGLRLNEKETERFLKTLNAKALDPND